MSINDLSYSGSAPINLILDVTSSGSDSITLNDDTWLQVNFIGNGQSTNQKVQVNNITIYGLQHFTGHVYYSFHAHKGDIITGSVLGSGSVKVYKP